MNAEAYQALDEGFEFFLRFCYSLLSADYCDQLLVFVIGCGENDPCTSAVTHLSDVSTTFSNKELVVLRLGTELSGVAFSLLQIELVVSSARNINYKKVIKIKKIKKTLQWTSTFSSARDSSCFLAFSTSSAGPLIVTASMPEPSVGKWMCTPPHSSMMERTNRPLEPIRELCNFDGMDTSTSVMFA